MGHYQIVQLLLHRRIHYNIWTDNLLLLNVFDEDVIVKYLCKISSTYDIRHSEKWMFYQHSIRHSQFECRHIIQHFNLWIWMLNVVKTFKFKSLMSNLALARHSNLHIEKKSNVECFISLRLETHFCDCPMSSWAYAELNFHHLVK